MQFQHDLASVHENGVDNGSIPAEWSSELMLASNGISSVD